MSSASWGWVSCYFSELLLSSQEQELDGSPENPTDSDRSSLVRSFVRSFVRALNQTNGSTRLAFSTVASSWGAHHLELEWFVPQSELQREMDEIKLQVCAVVDAPH